MICTTIELRLTDTGMAVRLVDVSGGMPLPMQAEAAAMLIRAAREYGLMREAEMQTDAEVETWSKMMLAATREHGNKDLSPSVIEHDDNG